MRSITILCRVVDNFGDIGTAWRLSLALKRCIIKDGREIKLNLVTDSLESFKKINSKIKLKAPLQECEGIFIYDWTDFSFCYRQFCEDGKEKLDVILELFQCGRPDWMEKILFDDKISRTVHIIMIDYLTAEPYAETFHCLKSLTRSAKVQKVNFMPGFTNKTGSLIIGEAFEAEVKRKTDGDILFFCYERNWLPLCRALNRFLTGEKSASKKVLVAQGRGRDSFLRAYSKGGFSFGIKELSFLDMEEWDEVFKGASFLFVRGEESLSRACLSGVPFVWQAYPQSENYQTVKVNALLDCMLPFFNESDFEIVRKAWAVLNEDEEWSDEAEAESAFYEFLLNANQLYPSFLEFSRSLRKNGDLARNLMTFIYKNDII